MPLFTVDDAKCTRCGACVEECPAGIISMRDALPEAQGALAARCINCGHCAAVCPTEALSLATMPVMETAGAALGPEAAGKFLRGRRSIRTYKDAPVSRESVEALIKTARYAPTGSNSQKVGWLVVGSRPEVARLSGIAVDWMRHVVGTGHPGADAYGFKGIIAAWEVGRDIICRGAPVLVIAHAPKAYPAAAVDCTIALSYLDLAAPSHGLGTCWAGFFMIALSHWPALRKELKVPDGCEVFGALMLGEPKYAYHRLPARNEPKISWQK